MLEFRDMKLRRLPCVVILSALLMHAQEAKPGEVEITSEPHHHLVLENESVRVFKVEVAPHESTLVHRHRHDYIYITLGASEVSNEVEGKPPVHLKLQDGETYFLPGNFAHLARDLAATPFRNITVELLQDEKARKAPPPKWDEDRALKVFSGGTQEILFVKDGVRVSEIELAPGGRAEPSSQWPSPPGRSFRLRGSQRCGRHGADAGSFQIWRCEVAARWLHAHADEFGQGAGQVCDVGVPRSKTVNTPLRNPDAHAINKHVESSVWLAGRLCATLVARPASKV